MVDQFIRMELVNRLRMHYEKYPPRLSYGGSGGKNVKGKTYSKWPAEEEFASLGVAAIQVWYSKIPASTEILPVEGYCVVDACLDQSGHLTPDALPLWLEMEGHAIYINVYVDMYACVHMRAIGGFTSYKTRGAIKSS